MRKTNLLILLAITSSAPALKAEEGWVNLLNRQSLAGWVQRGGQATYAVANDIIVGTSVLNTPNTFLCTEKSTGTTSSNMISRWTLG